MAADSPLPKQKYSRSRDPLKGMFAKMIKDGRASKKKAPLSVHLLVVSAMMVPAALVYAWGMHTRREMAAIEADRQAVMVEEQAAVYGRHVSQHKRQLDQIAALQQRIDRLEQALAGRDAPQQRLDVADEAAPPPVEEQLSDEENQRRHLLIKQVNNSVPNTVLRTREYEHIARRRQFPLPTPDS